MKKVMLGMVAFGIGAILTGGSALSQPPGEKGDKGGFGGKGGFPGGPGGFGGKGGGFKLGTVLPPFAAEQLKLTDVQKTQVAALEADLKAKLEKLLTPDQLKSLETMRGGFGGAGGKGGPGGDRGKGERPPV